MSLLCSYHVNFMYILYPFLLNVNRYFCSQLIFLIIYVLDMHLIFTQYAGTPQIYYKYIYDNQQNNIKLYNIH